MNAPIAMSGIPHAEARRRGRELRTRMRRSEHAHLAPLERDPVAILETQNADRLPGLVPVRMGRMLQTPFTFYRGAAAVMAHDLAQGPRTGAHVVGCGDAHMANFGMFASPERRMLFDLNDFDEAGQSPWEWDLKRLAASVVLGLRSIGAEATDQVLAAEHVGRSYRESLAELMELTATERYFFQVESEWLEAVVASDTQRLLRRTIRKARNRTSEQVLEKITARTVDGLPRIVDQPPIMVHVDHATDEEVDVLFASYRTTLRADTALLLSQYRIVDYAMRIVGVGSVGTRCYIILLLGPSDEALFLQAKEAPPSVLETWGGVRSVPPPGVPEVIEGRNGYRVVSNQRILQAQSDPFLGWISTRGRDFYWRQFRDMKGSVELEALSPSQTETYAGLCARMLARAHSQSPGAATICGYLGRSDSFDQALAAWSVAYADQTERDFAHLEAEVRNGRLAAIAGV